MNAARKTDRGRSVISACLVGAGLLVASGPWSHAQRSRNGSPAGFVPCAGDNGGITLPPGFCATVFADKLGHIRHLAITPNGVVYANTWSGAYYRRGGPPADGFLVALKDTKGDGRADQVERFGTTVGGRR